MIVFIVSRALRALQNTSLANNSALTVGSMESSESGQESLLSGGGAESQALDGLGGVLNTSSDLLDGVVEAGSGVLLGSSSVGGLVGDEEVENDSSSLFRG